LLPGNRERGAWNSACEKIRAATVFSAIKVVKIAFDDVPFRAVEPKCRARVMVNLERGKMFKASVLETQRLTAASGANLDYF
jgi:hypothetical protein